jgi:Ni/Co efflux regulator RcnB
MKSRRWICAGVVVMIALTSLGAFAEKNERGHGRGHEKDKKEQKHYYSDRDRDEMRNWYHEHARDLPPGLAKRDELPPGLARQLRVRGTLPPGLQKKIHPVPEEFVRRLPPPPPDCEHVLIGGNIVLLNRKTHLVLDIMALIH